MMLWMVLFWAVVLAGGVWFSLSWTRRIGRSDAMETLRTRLATGELGIDEFNERAATLGQLNDRSVGATLAVVILAVTSLMVIPVIVVAASGWDMDMWDMHGRGRDTTSNPVVRGGPTANVRVEDFTFVPGNLEVSVGATVTWTNEDSAPHDATARNGEWETDRLSEDESDSVTFSTAGTFDYYCSIHPSMKARLTVR